MNYPKSGIFTRSSWQKAAFMQKIRSKCGNKKIWNFLQRLKFRKRPQLIN